MIEVLYVILGVIFLLLPGFLLSFLLFDDPNGLSIWERIATSLGLSVLVDLLIITVLAQPPLKALRLFPFSISLIVFSSSCMALLFFRKRSLETFLSFWTSFRTNE